MGLRRWVSTVGMLAATGAGALAGLALVLFASPLPTFAYDRVSIIAWRGDDNVPAAVETTGWSAP
ncbi:MAG TPA: hypothetical protein VK464_21515, partial [Symbiobacteriaceae bacterium]|nr:hypothetical protein [Symbiobacteriaceae bacterium]